MRFLTAGFPLYRICTYRDRLLALPQLLLLPWLHRGRWGGCKGMPEGETGAEMCLGIIFMQPVISSASPPKKKGKKSRGVESSFRSARRLC